ncbi:MAG: hypothetical protein V1826_00620 [bacterium]
MKTKTKIDQLLAHSPLKRGSLHVIAAIAIIAIAASWAGMNLVKSTHAAVGDAGPFPGSDDPGIAVTLPINGDWWISGTTQRIKAHRTDLTASEQHTVDFYALAADRIRGAWVTYKINQAPVTVNYVRVGNISAQGVYDMQCVGVSGCVWTVGDVYEYNSTTQHWEFRQIESTETVVHIYDYGKVGAAEPVTAHAWSGIFTVAKTFFSQPTADATWRVGEKRTITWRVPANWPLSGTQEAGISYYVNSSTLLGTDTIAAADLGQTKTKEYVVGEEFSYSPTGPSTWPDAQIKVLAHLSSGDVTLLSPKFDIGEALYKVSFASPVGGEHWVLGDARLIEFRLIPTTVGATSTQLEVDNVIGLALGEEVFGACATHPNISLPCNENGNLVNGTWHLNESFVVQAGAHARTQDFSFPWAVAKNSSGKDIFTDWQSGPSGQVPWDQDLWLTAKIGKFGWAGATYLSRGFNISNGIAEPPTIIDPAPGVIWRMGEKREIKWRVPQDWFDGYTEASVTYYMDYKTSSRELGAENIVVADKGQIKTRAYIVGQEDEHAGFTDPIFPIGLGGLEQPLDGFKIRLHVDPHPTDDTTGDTFNISSDPFKVANSLYTVSFTSPVLDTQWQVGDTQPIKFKLTPKGGVIPDSYTTTVPLIYEFTLGEEVFGACVDHPDIPLPCNEDGNLINGSWVIKRDFEIPVGTYDTTHEFSWERNWTVDKTAGGYDIFGTAGPDPADKELWLLAKVGKLAGYGDLYLSDKFHIQGITEPLPLNGSYLSKRFAITNGLVKFNSFDSVSEAFQNTDTPPQGSQVKFWVKFYDADGADLPLDGLEGVVNQLDADGFYQVDSATTSDYHILRFNSATNLGEIRLVQLKINLATDDWNKWKPSVTSASINYDPLSGDVPNVTVNFIAPVQRGSSGVRNPDLGFTLYFYKRIEPPVTGIPENPEASEYSRTVSASAKTDADNKGTVVLSNPDADLEAGATYLVFIKTPQHLSRRAQDTADNSASEHPIVLPASFTPEQITSGFTYDIIFPELKAGDIAGVDSYGIMPHDDAVWGFDPAPFAGESFGDYGKSGGTIGEFLADFNNDGAINAFDYFPFAAPADGSYGLFGELLQFFQPRGDL